MTISLLTLKIFQNQLKYLIEKTLRKNGIGFGKLEGFNILPGNIATSVYPNYGKLNGAIIVTTENSKLKKK